MREWKSGRGRGRGEEGREWTGGMTRTVTGVYGVSNDVYGRVLFGGKTRQDLLDASSACLPLPCVGGGCGGVCGRLAWAWIVAGSAVMGGSGLPRFTGQCVCVWVMYGQR